MDEQPTVQARAAMPLAATLVVETDVHDGDRYGARVMQTQAVLA